MTIYFYLSIFFTSLCFYLFLKKQKININEDEIFKFLAIVLSLIASFRWKVGGDWETYLTTYERSNLSLINFDWSFIFELINYIFSSLQTGIYGVNLFVSSIFFLALYRLGKLLNFNLVLILLISFSLVYFNGIMGYVRQTLSLVFLIFSVECLLKDKKNFSLFMFSLAIFTHIASVVLFPIYFYLVFKNFKLAFIIILIVLFSSILGITRLEVAYREFVFKGMISLGALFRSIPLLICCIIYLIYRKKISTNTKILKFITDYLCFLSIFLILLIFLSPGFSAIADRLAFYMVIFQIIVIGQIFSKLIKYTNKNYLHYITFVSISYFSITFSWLIFGDYSVYWLDYNFLYLR